jgi:hypothetical protein
MRLASGWDKLPPGGSFALKEALRLLGNDDPELEAELKALEERLARLTDDLKGRLDDLRRRGIDPNGPDLPLAEVVPLGELLDQADDVCGEIDWLRFVREKLDFLTLREVRQFMGFAAFCRAHPSRDEQEAEFRRIFEPGD